MSRAGGLAQHGDALSMGCVLEDVVDGQKLQVGDRCMCLAGPVVCLWQAWQGPGVAPLGRQTWRWQGTPCLPRD